MSRGVAYCERIVIFDYFQHMSFMPKQLNIALCLVMAALGFAPRAFAQYNPTPDSIFKYNEEGQLTMRSYFRYDAKSRQTGVAHLTWNKKAGEWVGTYQELVEYDEAGNVLDKKTSFWDSDKYNWKLAEHESAKYDSEGRMTYTEVVRFNVQRDTWIGENKQEMKYDAQGHRTGLTTYRWDDDIDKWVPAESVVSEFSKADGSKISDTKQVWRQGRWVNEEKSTYTYNAKTSTLQTTVQSKWDGSAWVLASKTDYTKTISDGKTNVVTARMTYDAAKGEWVGDERQTTVIDSHGTELLSTREKWNFSSWVITQKERTDATYDQWGHCTSQVNYAMTGADQWEERTKVEKTYNEYGDVLTEIRLTWDILARAWKGIINEKREYGPMGDILSEEKKRWDRRTHEWKPQSKSSFSYDDEHNKISESTSSWNPQKGAYEEFFIGRASYKLNRQGYISEVVEQTKEEGTWKTRQTTRYY